MKGQWCLDDRRVPSQNTQRLESGKGPETESGVGKRQWLELQSY
jgi:hypothetical protein